MGLIYEASELPNDIRIVVQELAVWLKEYTEISIPMALRIGRK
jgi:hypothetical protein